MRASAAGMVSLGDAATSLLIAVLDLCRIWLLALRRGLILTHEVITLLSNLVAAVFYLSMIAILLPLVSLARLSVFAIRTLEPSDLDRDGGVRISGGREAGRQGE